MGWIGVDLDGTLAEYDSWKGAQDIGKPIEAMCWRVRKWLSEGKDVRIFTARACVPELIPVVEAWCLEQFGKELPVTNVKDFGMIELWDDRAIQVIANKGKRADGKGE